MRGRSRSKGPNPLTRSYESNGPDVKVRGTAQHIAEKYGQLARDAQASGDPVAAENYFQHAEHYLRIIATAQESLRQQYGNGRSDDDNDDDEESGGYGYGHGHGHGQSERGSQPQRVAPEDVDPALQPQPPSFDPRPDRQGERDYQPRGRGDRRERFQRPSPDNRSAGEAEARSARTDAPPPAEAPAREETPSREDAAPRRGRRRAAPSVSDEAVEQASLPDFLTRPVSRSGEETGAAEEAEAKPKRRRAATTTTRRTTRKSTAAATEGEGNASSEGEGGSDKTAAE
jgi:hypothetical protein